MITWQNGIPTSEIYNDIYYSRENGLEETRHVFLEGNNLPERWNALTKIQAYPSVIPAEAGSYCAAGNYFQNTNVNEDASHPRLRGDDSGFHIIETGFGTGLNFFAAWKLWNKESPDAKLYYTSIEKYPLALEDIRKAISYWPEFAEYLDEFASQYSENVVEESILIFKNIHLTLLWGDVNDALPNIAQPADAWFLDGFAPAKNPDMWNDNLYREMARLTVPGGTFATFTAVGDVRRGLQQSGFVVSKAPGYGKKRHILVGKIK